MGAARIVTLVGILLVLLAPSIQGQQRDLGLVHWEIGILDAFPVQRDFRAYGERKHVEFTLSVHNESEHPVVIDQARLRSAFALRLVIDGADAPAVWSWQSEIGRSNDTGDPKTTDLESPLLIEPKSSLTWTLQAERGDGRAFAAGEYGVAPEVTGFPAAVQAADGTPWRGRSNKGHGILRLMVVSPSTPQEIAFMHYQTALERRRKREPEEELRAYQRAAEADPTFMNATWGMAKTYMILDRHAEAIRVYEDIIRRFAATESTVKQASNGLALVLVKSGDEAGAAQTLRRLGVSEDRIDSELETFRKTLAAMRSR